MSYLIPSFINAAFSEEDPVVQMVQDESRHILYTRSEKGSINIYDLGTDGRGMSRVAAINISSIVQSAANIARTVNRSCFKPLVCSAPIESTNLHLVAITASGVRLYYSTLNWRSFNEATPSTRPVTLQLVQVRLPPGYAAKASPQRPQRVHSALYSHGTTFLATSTASDNDVGWTLPNSLFPAAQQLSETQNTLGLDGKTWALAEVTPSPKRAIESSLFAPPAPDPPLIVTQYSLGPRKFIFLTTQCCHVVTQLRPVDILRQLLFDASGTDSTAVRAFFQVLREDQACATALILACSTSIQDSQLADWAARAFFLLGGDVKISAHATSPASPFVVNSSVNLNCTPSHGWSNGGGEAVDYQFSGRHNGLYFYFGRILRPVWLMPLARDVGKPQQPLLDSVVTSEELLTVLGQLNALKGFVHANIHQNGSNSYQSSEKGRLQVKNLPF